MSKKLTKTDTKSTNYLGDSYWLNAAKQIEWPIDLKERHISVPESELYAAKDNLMVQHFVNNGWHIQSSIEVVKNRVFVAPVSDKPIFKPLKVVEVTEPKYKNGTKYLIKSTECIVQIVRLEKGKVQFHYLNRNKPDLLSSEENLDRVLRMQTWEVFNPQPEL